MSNHTSILVVYAAAATIAGGVVAVFAAGAAGLGPTQAAEREAALSRVEERRAFGATMGDAAIRASIDAVLDDFHAAAADADLERYFGHLAPGAIFVGTDASEVWTVDEFRAYAAPHFEAGRGWTYTPSNRRVDFAAGERSAALYEELTSAKYGTLRGSGTVVHDGVRWRILHYVMSFAVPNEVAPDLVELTAGER